MSIPSSVCMLIGRLCVCAIFILAGISKFAHFGPSVQEVASKGLPFASILLIIAAIVEILGGLSLLFGYKTRFWATILMLYLIPVTYFFHNFWSADEAHAQLQMIEFLKNLAIFGGLWVIIGVGAGKLSVDGAISKSHEQKHQAS